MHASLIERLKIDMGQFEAWEGKLFYYSGTRLGWRYVKDCR